MRDLNMGSIRSVDRAIDILQTFSVEKTSLTIDEISRITGIPNSTVYRILCTLERRGLVHFDQSSLVYKPGLRLMEFGFLQSSVLDLQQESEEILTDLHHKTNQTVLMAVADDDQIFYISKKEKNEGLKFSSLVGQRRPFIYGILGPVLLAFSANEKIERILTYPIPQHTPYTIQERNTIRQRLENIRNERYYIESNETNIGVTGVGAPIFDVKRDVIAAIGVIGPSVQLDDQLQEAKLLLVEAAKKISKKMGYEEF